MNDEFLKIVNWLTANKLSLNVKKTNYIIFHPYQKRLNYDANIKILDSRVNKYFNLERKEYVRYLGVMIDNHLSCLMFTITLPLIIFHISLFLLNKSTLTALAPPLLEIITLATLD